MDRQPPVTWGLVGLLCAALLSGCPGPADPVPTPNREAASTPPADSSASPQPALPSAAPAVNEALEHWAREFCGTIDSAQAAFGLGDDAGDSEDPVAARKQRAERLGLYSALLDAGAQQLESRDPPALAAAYHEAYAGYIRAQATALSEQIEALIEAETDEELGAIGVELNDATAAAAQRFNDALETVDPSVIAAMRAHPPCGRDEERDPESIRSANISAAIDPLLPSPSDLAPARWRSASFDHRDFRDVGRITTACSAALPNLNELGGPLSATLPADPESWGVRMFFNGAIGAHGSQLWSEVWAFATTESARAGYGHAREILTADGARDCLRADTEDEQVVDADLYFEVSESVAYAIDTHARDIDSHIEVHIIQRGRFVGMLIFFDHAPFELWVHDGERVLRLFEERLAAAP